MTQASFLISTRTAEPQGGNAPTNPSRNQARILSLPQFFIYPPRQPETSFRLVVVSSGFILNNLNTCAQRAASPCFPFTNGRLAVVGCLCSSSSRVRRRVTGADCPVAVDRRGYFTRVPHPIQTCTPPPHLLFLCSRLTPKGARVSRSYTTGEDGDGFWAPSQVGVFPHLPKRKGDEDDEEKEMEKETANAGVRTEPKYQEKTRRWRLSSSSLAANILTGSYLKTSSAVAIARSDVFLAFFVFF